LITLIQHKAFYHNAKGIASYNEKAYSSKDSGPGNNASVGGQDDLDGEKKLLSDGGSTFEDSTGTLEFDTMPLDDTKVTLSWTFFRVEYTSLDKKLNDETNEICKRNETELIDLRSYMIEHPETCT
jgi:hypothetical protein